MRDKEHVLIPLPEELRPLLERVVRKRNPMVSALVLAGNLEQLTASDYEQIRVSLGKELCETGLTESDEPNITGDQIETLIDWIGRRLRWMRSESAP